MFPWTLKVTGCDSPGKYAIRSGPTLRSIRALETYATSLIACPQKWIVLRWLRSRPPAPEEPKKKSRAQWSGPPRLRTERHTVQVLSDLPPGGGQMTLRKVARPGFQRRGQSVVPAIQKTKQGENRDDLQDLVVIEVTAQFRELDIPNSSRHLAGGSREAQGRTFGLTEIRALLKLPKSFNFVKRDVAKSRKIGRMRCTILAPRGAADHVHDKCFQARIKSARANDDYRRQLGKGSEELRIARHDQHTVGHEPHNSFRDREYGIERFRVFTTRRGKPHVRSHLRLALSALTICALSPSLFLLVPNTFGRAVEVERLNLNLPFHGCRRRWIADRRVASLILQLAYDRKPLCRPEHGSDAGSYFRDG